MDDILIFTETLVEHHRIVKRVLEILAKNKLYLKAEKCNFEQTQVEYLGLIISAGKMEMDPVKIEGVSHWPIPNNVKQVQSFLGFVNFYRRFIQDFSDIAKPLHDLTRKDFTWNWSDACQEAFDTLKKAITSAPVLIFPDESKPYKFEADSSNYATGAVLSQEGEDQKWHPVAFLSKSLSSVERNYDIHDKELLAIIRALEEWRHYLEGAQHKITIWTDHKNLEYFKTAKKLNRRQARWSLYIVQI
jgi:RNase H-like domain found in reverse transcriptase/Reverse transcriptase (RNA-dependent DNA polymerase)